MEPESILPRFHILFLNYSNHILIEQKPTDRIDRNFVYRLGLLTSSEKKKNKKILITEISSFPLEKSVWEIIDYEIWKKIESQFRMCAFHYCI
ncbi:unnamed protein product [Caenorhabditis angaria]|uniref:Uncharacterized protein n=1 Tax=Caenorhabditis angaria TaxID=860376 RepID=A0A9P1NB91_9PELO|nr:unnamed protein product [Caenorhabditis angaria]